MDSGGSEVMSRATNGRSPAVTRKLMRRKAERTREGRTGERRGEKKRRTVLVTN
jgi:hypothetical protein